MSAAPAYCGLICDTCPILLATVETDQAEQEKMRAEIAELNLKDFEAAGEFGLSPGLVTPAPRPGALPPRA
jgi:hypothetical protein